MIEYATLLTALHTRLSTVAGLSALLAYEPTSVGTEPLLYSLLDSYEMANTTPVKHTWRVLHRVCVTWQDNRGAEALLMPFLASIPAAINADPRLAGLLPNGYARITGAQAVFVVIGGSLCRAYDFTSESFSKEPR